MLPLLIITSIISTTYLIKMLYDERKKIEEEEAYIADTSVTKRIKEKYNNQTFNN